LSQIFGFAIESRKCVNITQTGIRFE